MILEHVPIGHLGIAELGRALRSGCLSATSLAHHVIRQHRQHGELLGAYKFFDERACLAQAAVADSAFKAGMDLGPLQGIPISVKDMYGVSGWPTFAGAKRALPNQWRSEGPLVQGLRRQLAVLVGKTHTVEFALGGLGLNNHHGTPRNPWDTTGHRVPGGSSSGAGVSLLEGSAWVALGTDTAGSVRVPAAYTGTVGFRPSPGTWSTRGIVPLSSTCDTPGVLVRTAADLALVYRTLSCELSPTQLPTPKPLAGYRLGVDRTFFFARCAPGIAEAVENVLTQLASAGADIVEVRLTEADEAYEIFHDGGIAGPELLASFGTTLPDRHDELDESVRLRLSQASSMTATTYIRSIRKLDRLAQQAEHRLSHVDAMLTPSTLNLPPLLEDLNDPQTYIRANIDAMGNTGVFSLFGFCALSMPVALSHEGLPIGLQLAAPRGAEAMLVQIACAIEDMIGNARQLLGTPPLLQQQLEPRLSSGATFPNGVT
ncbi:amidase [Ottowia thiooxydans]|uniref:Aspartyl-tRNA(Asn)/glutamyl-tRNA(Gln) amidotransferase subunit A n=1 Tax=Ottowia thiooxydans TaxID=219182 RepID=A0ABV2Q983_9BURK